MTPRFDDVEWFVRRLRIIDMYGRRRFLGPALFPEQLEFIRLFKNSRKDILVLKPRQMGMTTVVIACLFWKLYTSPHPLGALSVMHEDRACKRVNRMIKEYINGLPLPLRPGCDPYSMHEIGMLHNDAQMAHLMAGSRGEGRSFTFQFLHASEMGQWPQGSAATKEDDEGADENSWASINATMHEMQEEDPTLEIRRICEFTGDGPSGVGYGLVKTARESPDWEFMFFEWFRFPHYEVDPPPDWKRDEENFGEHAEAALIALHYGWPRDHPRIDRKLAWRRKKITSQKYSFRRFKREYPSSWQDPFVYSEKTWFTGDLIVSLQGKLPMKWREESFADELRVYFEAEPDRTYFIGMDTSGGLGGDDAVIVVLRDDYQICAVWASNTTPVYAQAEMGAKLSARYNRALVLCEQNRYGKDAIERLESLGVPTWKDHRGKNFWMQSGRAGESKAQVYGLARDLVNKEMCCSAEEGEPMLLCDEVILQQMLTVREDAKGRLEAPAGEHDDHVDAYVLALWCGRWHYRRAEQRREDPEEAKLRFIQAVRGR